MTLSTLSASLLAHSSELLVATVSQLVSSVETRPAGRSVRLSASAPSLLVEGTSLERDLVPIVSPADIHGTGEGRWGRRGKGTSLERDLVPIVSPADIHGTGEGR